MTAVSYLEGRTGDHRGEQECILILYENEMSVTLLTTQELMQK